MADHGLPTDGAETIGEVLASWAAWQPGAKALTAASATGSRLTLTFAELDEMVTRVAFGLVRLGVTHGDRVAFLLTNNAGLEGVLIYLGSHRAGCVSLPFNSRSTPVELTILAAHAETRMLVYERAFRDHARKIHEAVGTSLIEVGTDLTSGAMPFDSLIAPNIGEGTQQLPVVTGSDFADWLFTSGTTGSPKCVMLSHANCVAHAHMFPRAVGIREDDIYLTPFPFFTSSGVHTSLLVSLGSGAHYVMSATVEADRLLREIVTEGATIVAAVPALYSYMAQAQRKEQADLSAVRIACHGGAPVAPHQVRAFRELFPRAEILNLYGQTESGNPGTYLPGRFAECKAGSIGDRGMPGVKVRVVDAVSGLDIEPGGVGELLLQSASVMSGYFKDAEATAETVRNGWLHTGDLVRVDEEGFMFIHDRLKDIIIRGGHNISSLEVEEAISAHEAVLEAAVVAKPHPELGEDLVAFVVTTPHADVSAHEIRQFCLERVADYKVPRDIRFIEVLPRNPTGKILKRDLRRNVQIEAPPRTEV